MSLKTAKSAAVWLLIAVLMTCACGRSQPEPSPRSQPPPPPSASTSATAVPDKASPAPGADPFDALLGRTEGRPLPKDLIVGGDCPPVDRGDEEMAAQAAARVPLKEGLTLSQLWNPSPDKEYECLTQVTKVDRDGVEISVSCNLPGRSMPVRRKICRADLRAAHMLHTGLGEVEIVSAAGDLPETIVGATEFSFSADQFRELKRAGSVRDHYVQLGDLESLSVETESVLRTAGPDTMSVIVNNQPVEVPVVRAEGDAEMWRFGKNDKGRVKVAILDDDRFPMLVDYRHSTGADGNDVFTVHPSKITYPSKDDLEDQLGHKKRVVVYGIYFDFASDRIRAESEPILKEIADVLAKNADWKLRIEGHTDNVGGAQSNLELSQRRSAAVQRALVDRYHVAGSRLTTWGLGMSVPKDTNDTPEGRAKNRRVELTRED
jgi:outer membrane protein OmpA-like peptidoglycan-associated protein